MTIFKTEKHRQDFLSAFKKMTMSGAINKDAAIEKLIRDNPHYFHQPSADELKKIARAELNSEIRQRARAGVQSSKPTYDIFANVPPTDKTRDKPA
jgi:hypothetical protein